MNFKQKFVRGKKVYHSTEKIIKVEQTSEGYKIATERRKDFTLKIKTFKNAPHVGNIIIFYFISVSDLVDVEVNGLTYYLIDKDELNTVDVD